MSRIPLSHRLLIGSGLLFAGFVACQLSDAAIGQHIEKVGTLREPFFLIPISVLIFSEQQRQLGRSGPG